MFLMKSNGSAGVKQRALQILAHATSSSADPADPTLARFKTRQNNSKVQQDSSDSSSDDEPSISVQSRRRLLGYEGTENDMDDYHFPELVLVSPLTLIDLLVKLPTHQTDFACPALEFSPLRLKQSLANNRRRTSSS